MARPQKQTVDYFPHDTEQRKTLFILQSKWGNDGFSEWFKILDRLGATENHVLNLNDPAEFSYLAAYCLVPEETLTEILNQCAVLNAINGGLWRHKLLYSENLVKNVADAYRRRADKLPTLDKIKSLFVELLTAEIPFPTAETPLNEQSDVNNGEREREREIKEKKNNKKKKPADFIAPDFIPPETWAAYLALRDKKKAAKTTYALELIVSELRKIKKIHNHDPVAVLNQSIKSGWIDVYPLKEKGNGNGKSYPYRTGNAQGTDTALDKYADEIDAINREFYARQRAEKETASPIDLADQKNE